MKSSRRDPGQGQGYGASRRLGRAGIRGDEQPSIRAGTVRTLFDADATLRPLASWAMDLHYVKGESFLELIRSALAELLPDVTFRNIDKTRKTLIFDTADGPVSLDDLSDGYQNVAAWIGDLLYRTTAAFDDYFNPLATRGLLLIDEVDLHLHVKWQRRLRRFLGDKLPNFQIVATTHSPMTAQQAGTGEVHVLARATPQAMPELRDYDVAPDRLGLHQLIEPFFGVETVDSAERIANLPGSQGRETPISGYPQTARVPARTTRRRPHMERRQGSQGAGRGLMGAHERVLRPVPQQFAEPVGPRRPCLPVARVQIANPAFEPRVQIPQRGDGSLPGGERLSLVRRRLRQRRQGSSYLAQHLLDGVRRRLALVCPQE